MASRGRCWYLLLVAIGCIRPEPSTSRQITATLASTSAVIAPRRTNQQTARPGGAASDGPWIPDAGPVDFRPFPPNSNPAASPSSVAAPSGNGPNDAETNRRPCHLLAAGDSLTDPKSSGGGYLEAARRHCSCQVTNLGKGGAMVNQIRARLLAHLEDSSVSYSHVVVFGGVNDLYSDLTAKRTVDMITSDLETMYRAARRSGAKVIAISVTPWGGFRRYFTEHRWENTLALNRWIRESMSRGLTDAVLDGEHLLACGTAERICEKYATPFRDGLHFGPLGHRQLALALVRALGPIQCPSAPDDGPDEGSSGG